jgi:uncharacterized protein YijF (DUF1287 family)
MAALTGCTHSGPTSTARLLPVRQSAVADDPLADMPMTAASDKIAVRIVNRAKSEVRLGVVYDAAYRKILYPGGDVPPDRGACTDVVIRSLRSAGFDLQTLIHRDMLRNQSHYAPGRRDSGLDSNIDHRRVPNQRAFMKYHATVLPVETSGAAKKSWQPGDIVYWKLENGLDHCGVVSNCIGQSGLPMVIHNLAQAAQEDVLTTWKITGHYRFPARKQAGAGAR